MRGVKERKREWADRKMYSAMVRDSDREKDIWESDNGKETRPCRQKGRKREREKEGDSGTFVESPSRPPWHIVTALVPRPST